MKIFIALACFAAIAFAANDVNVLLNEAEVNPEDFKYAYEFDNTIKAQQQGVLRDGDTWVVNGQYSYISPEGEQVSLQYTADENGYHVDAANPLLPTSPPIPEAIQRSLEYIASHPSRENSN